LNSGGSRWGQMTEYCEQKSAPDSCSLSKNASQ